MIDKTNIFEVTNKYMEYIYRNDEFSYELM